ncbi:glycoside hydrolase family 32 protein [Marinoscillum furvescens]|uniref:Fructan beta-fructosidase n=1 Tax=Marinoscillum furvescens DSM 4134 TaxID=1122208 RepID=A0A3D9LI43_MARFU|nr:glycoside hydrolase family 32 protein [Marinoscillum furvescens]REE05535.1 fructan beta-fructosidase [Marinoscillum furvescens DSM 4134]
MKFSIILFAVMLLGCTAHVKKQQPSVQADGEEYRPQYHFTPPAQWMNDPNGMVYFEGEYHLFYQHYPDSNVWGPMHWGHAVSTDMVHWEHLPIALYPDSLGYIFSGSAVVDRHNTTGFGANDKPAMVAIYTYHDPVGASEGQIDYQTQGIAYSLDKGRTWTKYEGNPVLPNPGIIDYRDPKVFWYDKDQSWRMILAVKDRVHIYASPDLINWEKKSEFGAEIGAHGGVWECPDLFELPIAGGESKWVMLVSINPGGPQGGSATQYFVGAFDGDVFTPEDEQTRWLDYGADNYAGVTWSDIPDSDGRRLFIGWMSNWQYANVVPTYTWRSAMTIPRELVLLKQKNNYLLQSKPVQELQSLIVGEQAMGSDLKLTSATQKIMVNKVAQGTRVSIKNAQGEMLVIVIEEEQLVVDRSKAGKSAFSDVFAARHTASLGDIVPVTLTVYMDRSSVEVFVNEGELVMTNLVFPEHSFERVQLSGPGQMKMVALKSIWGEQQEEL